MHHRKWLYVENTGAKDSILNTGADMAKCPMQGHTGKQTFVIIFFTLGIVLNICNKWE